MWERERARWWHAGKGHKLIIYWSAVGDLSWHINSSDVHQLWELLVTVFFTAFRWHNTPTHLLKSFPWNIHFFFAPLIHTVHQADVEMSKLVSESDQLIITVLLLRLSTPNLFAELARSFKWFYVIYPYFFAESDSYFAKIVHKGN